VSAVIALSIPGEPQGKGRPRFARRGAKTASWTPLRTARYEGEARAAAIAAMKGRPPIAGAVSVAIMACMPIPASWPKRKRSLALGGDVRPAVKPDIDNVAKAVLDAMCGVVFEDDRQVCKIFAEKLYSESPRVEVVVCG